MTGPAPTRRSGRWIERWDPEDEAFWQAGGERVARRNLWFSVLSEHIGFSVWTCGPCSCSSWGPSTDSPRPTSSC